MKSNSAHQNNAAAFFTGPSSTRLVAGTEALVQLCPDKRRTGTVLVEQPQLLIEEMLSAKMPAVMPCYPAAADWGFHTANLLLRHYWDKTAISLSGGNLDFLFLSWARRVLQQGVSSRGFPVRCTQQTRLSELVPFPRPPEQLPRPCFSAPAAAHPPPPETRGEATGEGEEDVRRSLRLKQPGGPRGGGQWSYRPDPRISSQVSSKSCTAPREVPRSGEISGKGIPRRRAFQSLSDHPER